jgi:membrane fusion protein, multidrug efflux system
MNRTFGISAVVLAGTLAVAGCRREARGMPARAAPAPVTVATALRRNVPVEIGAIGTVQAISSVDVKSQVAGRIERVFFAEGADVTRGSRLFLIDPRPFQAALHQAEATLRRDRAQEKGARLQADRARALVKQSVVSQQELEQAVAAADALTATVLADRAQVENARLNLQYCSIHAPIDGRTGPLLLTAGNLVKANDNPVLVTVTQVSPIYVSLAVPQVHLPAIRRAMAAGALAVGAVIPGDEERPLAGQVTFLGSTVDASTGTIQLKATFANRDRRLWPGAFVTVSLSLSVRRDAVVVPTQAVQTGQQGPYLFVVTPEMVAEARPVSIGPAHAGETVVEQGLAPGERVVTDGQLRLAPGAPVVVQREP